MLIGKWNRSVVLTYLSVAACVFGIVSCLVWQNLNWACVYLVLAGIFDVFDGKVARSMKRTEQDKAFGIELDSLADTLSFIALPIVICISSGFDAWYLFLALIWFAICGIARLAHFNTLAAEEDGPVKYYHGLPVTFTALILPIVYLLIRNMPAVSIQYILVSTLLIIGCLNVIDFKMPKPKGSVFYAFIAVIAVVIIGVLLA